VIHHRFRCVIFHMTDVPYGRGGSPLQNLIVRGQTDTVITAMQCVDEMDAGDVYLKRPLSLEGTAEEIFRRAAVLMADMSVELVETEPHPVPQTGPVTTFTRRTPADSVIDRDESVEELFDLIRMLDAEGYPPPPVSLWATFGSSSATPPPRGMASCELT
jgi:methionyl-tRNA formyltransferase